MRSFHLPPALLCAGILLTGVGGCFNDAFRGPEFEAGVGVDRFGLVIEADRTDVEGTHFLVDHATGDLWVLQGGAQAPSTWVRLADAPADATPFASLVARKAQPEEGD